jgi:hypothetical protein
MPSRDRGMDGSLLALLPIFTSIFVAFFTKRTMRVRIHVSVCIINCIQTDITLTVKGAYLDRLQHHRRRVRAPHSAYDLTRNGSC